MSGLRKKTITRRQFLWSTGAGLAAATLAACASAVPNAGTGASTGEEAAPTAEEGGPKYGGTLGLMGHQEVAGLSPEFWGPSVQTTMIRAIHDSLVLKDEWVVIQPLLAESFEISDDGLTYTFNLRQGVKFHDDTELTAADVQYTFDFYRNPDTASRNVGRFNGIESVDIPDDYTVVLNMSEVNAALMSDGAECPIVQSQYHAEVGEDLYAQSPIGTGAFKVLEFNPAEVVLVEAFEDHFRGHPYIDQIRQEVVPEPSVRTIALQTETSDSALWPLLTEDSLTFKDDPNYTVIVTLTGGVKHLPINNKVPQLSDKRVRQAMLYALDRQRIIDDLWSGTAVMAHSNLSPKYAFYSRNDDPTLKQYEYDPERAKALLDEAGWVDEDGDGIREKDGMKLSFTCTTITGDQARRPIAELAQLFFLEVGIDMQLAEAPISAILEGLRSGSIEASLYNWTYGSTDPDPSNTLRSDGGQNWNSFENERVDELIDLGRTTVNPDERQKFYHEIQEIVVEEVPMLYLMYDEWMNVFTGRVKGLPEAPQDSFPMYYNGLHKWWLDDV